jgi:hypothetical protein
MFLLKSKPQTFASLALASQAKYLFLYVNQSAIEKCLEYGHNQWQLTNSSQVQFMYTHDLEASPNLFPSIATFH